MHLFVRCGHAQLFAPHILAGRSELFYRSSDVYWHSFLNRASGGWRMGRMEDGILPLPPNGLVHEGVHRFEEEHFTNRTQVSGRKS